MLDVDRVDQHVIDQLALVGVKLVDLLVQGLRVSFATHGKAWILPDPPVHGRRTWVGGLQRQESLKHLGDVIGSRSSLAIRFAREN